jgi:anti-anti-sigma factor
VQKSVRSKLSGARRRVAFGRSRRFDAGHPEPSLRPVDPAPARSRDMLPRSTSSRREFRLERSSDGGRATISPSGELDGASVVQFEETVSEILATAHSVVLDLRGLTFIDSSGLWAVTLIHKTCRRRGISLRLIPGPEHVQSVFEVTGLYDLLPFVPPGPAGAAAAP